MQFFSNWGSVSGYFEIGVIFIVFLALTYVGVCILDAPARSGHQGPLFYAEVPGQKGRRREGLTAGDKTKGVSLWL